LRPIQYPPLTNRLSPKNRYRIAEQDWHELKQFPLFPTKSNEIVDAFIASVRFVGRHRIAYLLRHNYNAKNGIDYFNIEFLSCWGHRVGPKRKTDWYTDTVGNSVDETRSLSENNPTDDDRTKLMEKLFSGLDSTFNIKIEEKIEEAINNGYSEIICEDNEYQFELIEGHCYIRDVGFDEITDVELVIDDPSLYIMSKVIIN